MSEAKKIIFIPISGTFQGFVSPENITEHLPCVRHCVGISDTSLYKAKVSRLIVPAFWQKMAIMSPQESCRCRLLSWLCLYPLLCSLICLHARGSMRERLRITGWWEKSTGEMIPKLNYQEIQSLEADLIIRTRCLVDGQRLGEALDSHRDIRGFKPPFFKSSKVKEATVGISGTLVFILFYLFVAFDFINTECILGGTSTATMADIA